MRRIRRAIGEPGIVAVTEGRGGYDRSAIAFAVTFAVAVTVAFDAGFRPGGWGRRVGGGFWFWGAIKARDVSSVQPALNAARRVGFRICSAAGAWVLAALWRQRGLLGLCSANGAIGCMCCTSVGWRIRVIEFRRIDLTQQQGAEAETLLSPQVLL